MCHNLICSTEFQIISIDQIRMGDVLSVGLTSGDIYRHNLGNRFQIFPNTFSEYHNLLAMCCYSNQNPGDGQ